MNEVIFPIVSETESQPHRLADYSISLKKEDLTLLPLKCLYCTTYRDDVFPAHLYLSVWAKTA